MKQSADFLAYALAMAVMKPFSALPLGLSRTIGRCVGLLWWALDFKHRALVKKNLNIAFPSKSPAEIGGLCRKVFENMGMSFADFAFGENFTSANVERYIKVAGFENYQKAHESGRAVILAGGHQACWEWESTLQHWTKRPFYVIQKRIKNRFMDDFAVRRRARFGVVAVHPRGAVAELAGHAGEDCDFGFYTDQRADRVKGLYVGFFGRNASTSAGLGVLARTHGVAVVPGSIRRTGYGAEIKIFPMIETPVTSDADADIKEVTRRVNKFLEDRIRECPEEYFWVHDRWRWTSPTDIDTTSPENWGRKKRANA